MKAFAILLSFSFFISCTSRQKEEKEQVLLPDSDSVTSIRSFVARSVGSMEPESKVMAIKLVSSNYPARLLKITGENLTNDTLFCVGYDWEIREDDGWRTIPRASEGVAWVIPSRSKSDGYCSMPYDFCFKPGMYRVKFSFSPMYKEERNEVRMYFELVEE